MDIDIKIKDTLLSINDITLKIEKELECIEEFVKENGHLHTVVGTANEILSKKAQDMGLNVADIINQSKRQNRSETNLLNSQLVTSTIVTKKLKQLN